MAGEGRQTAETGTGTGDDEQSAPVKERRGSRGRPELGGGKPGVEVNGEGERERPGRNNGRIILPGYFSK